MKKRQASVIPFLLALAAAGPAAAQNGNIYVPLASNLFIGGANYSTKVWVSNPDGATHHINTTFIQSGVDGTTGASPASPNLFMTSTTTLVMPNAAPAGQTGLLSINGPAVLVVGARIEVTSADGSLLGIAAVPVITQNDVVAAGSYAEVQGLQRGIGNVISDFALVNLGSTAAQCTVGAILSSGATIAAPTSVGMAALSRRDFSDVLAILGQASVSDVRVVATCSQPFYAFATVYAPGTGSIAVVAPSQTLAGSVGPALSTGSGGGTTTGDVTLNVPGLFLDATASDSEQGYNLPAPVGVAYKRATITWDMHIGTFPSGLFTGVMAFRRPNKLYSLREPFCAVQIVNRNSKTVLDLGLETAYERTTGPWKENSDYHCQLVYDLTIDQCSLSVSDGSGPVIYTIAGPSQWFDMSATATEPLNLDFGQTGIGDGAYYPPISWTFSNLSVLLEPK